MGSYSFINSNAAQKAIEAWLLECGKGVPTCNLCARMVGCWVMSWKSLGAIFSDQPGVRKTTAFRDGSLVAESPPKIPVVRVH